MAKIVGSAIDRRTRPQIHWKGQWVDVAEIIDLAAQLRKQFKREHKTKHGLVPMHRAVNCVDCGDVHDYAVDALACCLSYDAGLNLDKRRIVSG